MRKSYKLLYLEYSDQAFEWDIFKYFLILWTGKAFKKDD